MPYWTVGGRGRNAYLAEQAFAKEQGQRHCPARMERLGGTGIALGGGHGAVLGGVRPMPNRVQDGQQPEALRSLKSAAKAGSQKPDDQGLEARGDTAPIPASPEQEQDAAAKVLREGVKKNPRGMEEAAKKAPRR
ncbi:hypothetical protein IC232_10335 [Microvirga sp. BT688]|uniref:hypothetical protein n=1 Tax=Microvirga sp. TaxID=1873136 RepID=UPI001681F4E6|nr:hypothetical protein [Microvirga sp.]MBD2747087.1 hypothetical protein [Microvirga sp.]